MYLCPYLTVFTWVQRKGEEMKRTQPRGWRSRAQTQRHKEIKVEGKGPGSQVRINLQGERAAICVHISQRSSKLRSENQSLNWIKQKPFVPLKGGEKPARNGLRSLGEEKFPFKVVSEGNLGSKEGVRWMANTRKQKWCRSQFSWNYQIFFSNCQQYQEHTHFNLTYRTFRRIGKILHVFIEHLFWNRNHGEWT